MYITSDNKKFLEKEEALIKEYELTENKEYKIKENKMNNNKRNHIRQLFVDRNWGIYSKGDPLQSLPIQDGFKMFKVNDVNLDELLDAVMGVLEEGQQDQWTNNNSSQNLTNETE